MAVCGSDLQGLRFDFQAGSFRKRGPAQHQFRRCIGQPRRSSHLRFRESDWSDPAGSKAQTQEHEISLYNMKDGFSRQPSTKAPRVSVPKMQGVRVDEPERENSQR